MNRLKCMIVAFVVGLGSASLAQNQQHAGLEPPPDGSPQWGQILAEDAQAFHDIVLENHPGAVDPANAGFNLKLDAGLELALTRARTATTRGAYVYALLQYVSSFDDGHLQFKNDFFPPPTKVREWPGFLTRDIGGREVVFVREGAADPPLGSTLVECDGHSPKWLLDNRVIRYNIHWALEGPRQQISSNLFYQADNPYSLQPTTCIFKARNQRKTYHLDWHPIPAKARWSELLAPIYSRTNAGISLHQLGDGYWIDAGSFDSDNKGDVDLLNRLVHLVKDQAPLLRSSRFIVLDLRGNVGGNSYWSDAIAKAIWGDAYVAAREEQNIHIDYRVSAGNIARIKELVAREQDTGDDAEVAQKRKLEAAMTAAAEAGEQLYRFQDETVISQPFADSPVSAKAYVITDNLCASSCLDAVDLWKALGAKQVGRPTSADTYYMDVRRFDLPSGLGWGVLPMKVYRGRHRRSNVPQIPDFLYKSDLSDTAALERFILELNSHA